MILLLSLSYAGANGNSYLKRYIEWSFVVCTDDTGYWMMSLAEGVTDFAYGGSKLNTKYYCFEGCLNTGTALQNYKVQLAGTNATMLERARVSKEIKALHASIRG